MNHNSHDMNCCPELVLYTVDVAARSSASSRCIIALVALFGRILTTWQQNCSLELCTGSWEYPDALHPIVFVAVIFIIVFSYLREAIVQKIPEFYEIFSQRGGVNRISYLLFRNY